jgi:acetolactate synthase-1/3 small subunit
MQQEFTITLFSEKQEGLITKTALILTRRKININSFTVVFCKTVNLYRFTITLIETEEAVQNIVHQMEKIIEVFKCYLQTEAELSTHQILLLKLSNSDKKEDQIATIINAFPIIKETDYCVYTIKAHKATIQQLATTITELEPMPSF